MLKVPEFSEASAPNSDKNRPPKELRALEPDSAKSTSGSGTQGLGFGLRVNPLPWIGLVRRLTLNPKPCEKTDQLLESQRSKAQLNWMNEAKTFGLLGPCI